MKKIICNIICVTGVYSEEISNMLLFSQVSGLVENCNIWVFSHTMNVSQCQTLHDGATH